MAGDDHCGWAPWFKAHFKFEKVEREGGDLAKWKAEHGAMVDARAAALRAQGYTVYLEHQNKFTVVGSNGAELVGTPDVVAVRRDEALVVDCKSGKRRDKDFWQVVLYMLMLPRTHEGLRGVAELRGQIEYRDALVAISPAQATSAQARVKDILRLVGGPEAPARVPSAHECRFCDIRKADCPERIEAAPQAAVPAHDVF